MANLIISTLGLWPKKSYEIIKQRGLSTIKLKKRFGKNIIFPWNDDYDKNRMLFSTQIQERPLFIIKPKHEKDIISIFNLIKNYSLSVRIVGGRHSTGLQNPEIFIDMSFFNKISHGKYLIVGAGSTQGQVNNYLFNHNLQNYFPGCKPNHPNDLIFPGGSASTVGIAGISTVGGIGTLRRTYGLTIDHIKYFKIVIPPTTENSAKIIIASKNNNSDLFWALRGGGGANFGIILEIAYKHIKINDVILYDISWDFNQAEDIIKLWQKTAIKRPNSFNEDLSVFTTDDIQKPLIIHLTGLYVAPKNELRSFSEKIIRDEVEYLGGSLSISNKGKYSDIYKKFVKERIYHSFSVGKTFLTKNTVPSKIIIDSLNQMKKDNGQAYIGIQLMGGKISSISSGETAFYPRESLFFVDIFNFWNSPTDQEINMKWNGKLFYKLFPILGPYTYLGFPISNLQNHTNSYYGKNKDRLVKIKNKFDPLGLLKFHGSL